MSPRCSPSQRVNAFSPAFRRASFAQVSRRLGARLPARCRREGREGRQRSLEGVQSADVAQQSPGVLRGQTEGDQPLGDITGDMGDQVRLGIFWVCWNDVEMMVNDVTLFMWFIWLVVNHD